MRLALIGYLWLGFGIAMLSWAAWRTFHDGIGNNEGASGPRKG